MNPRCRERILSNDYADWLTDFELTEELLSRETGTSDFCYRQIDEGLGLAFVKREATEPIGLLNYSYQRLPNVFGLQELTTAAVNVPFDSLPLVSSGIMQVQREPLNLTGKNVILAFIGTGIDYQNPLFRRPDGSSRILAVWDQTIQSDNPPEGFDYGTEYTREQLNEALQSENPRQLVPTTDTNGHGTAMASVAAGSAVTSPQLFTGAAPEADILVVKLKECKPYLRQYYLLPEEVPAYQSTDICMAVEYADSFAGVFYRPVIFCLGFGSNFGSHSGESPLSSYLNRIGDKRSRVMVIGGGSEGNTGHHYEGRLNPVGMMDREGRIDTTGAADSEKAREEIEIRVGEGENGFLTEIWGKAPNIFSLSIRSPGGEEIPNTGVRTDKGIEYRFVYERTRITVSYALVEGISGDELITVRFEKPTPGIWTLLLQNDRGTPGAEFHVWLPVSAFLNGETYFLKGNPEITLTVPGYAENSITLSSYSTVNNSIYVASGRGFSRGSSIKPDLAAPAVEVSAAIRSLPGELRLGKLTGAPLAAAMTAGGIAQFLQWQLDNTNIAYLRSAEVKNYLIRGALREANLTYPNRLWGFGRLSIQGVFDSLAGP